MLERTKKGTMKAAHVMGWVFVVAGTSAIFGLAALPITGKRLHVSLGDGCTVCFGEAEAASAKGGLNAMPNALPEIRLDDLPMPGPEEDDRVYAPPPRKVAPKPKPAAKPAPNHAAAKRKTDDGAKAAQDIMNGGH